MQSSSNTLTLKMLVSTSIEPWWRKCLYLSKEVVSEPASPSPTGGGRSGREWRGRSRERQRWSDCGRSTWVQSPCNKIHLEYIVNCLRILDDNFQKTTSANLLPVTHKREKPGETPRRVLILVPVPGHQMLIASSLNRKANVHNTDYKSYLELSFHPWCSHLLQYGVLSGRKEFIPCPTHHLILGPVFFKDTSILIQNGKISTSLKNEDGALENVFVMRRLLRRWLHCSASRVIVSCCNICLIFVKQQNSFYYLGKFHDFFLQTTKYCDWYQQMKQFCLADKWKKLSSPNQRENTTL